MRSIKAVYTGKPTLEGAGVHLKRVFGHAEVPSFDPFLLLDDFHSDRPEDYLPGFPWHPHRGIETVTYLLQGRVEHGDSLGNSGVIGPGDVQWMTAGSGIIHQEMPKATGDGCLWGLQLWVNLPARNKMMPPRYRDILASDIPVFNHENETQVKVICGRYRDLLGPAQDIVMEPGYLEIFVPPGQTFTHAVPQSHTVLAYVLEGRGYFSLDKRRSIAPGQLVFYDLGLQISIEAQENPLHFLLISGAPIREPVAWYGPIVMNTQEELRQAFEAYRNGTFIQLG